jgi:hypothetical protein
MKTYKKYIIAIGVLIVLSPLGLIVPDLFKAGNAWGEWSVESIKKQIGFEPSGMKKDAAIYSAPVPDYNLGKEDDPLPKLSLSYIMSGLIGIGIILILTFVTVKLMSRKQTE